MARRDAQIHNWLSPYEPEVRMEGCHQRADQVWPYIADTNRINQYAGLPEFTFRYILEKDGGSHQIGETPYWGWHLRWDEHP